MEYKCKNCGGELHFDPKIGKLKCDFCDSIYEISEYETPQSHQYENTDRNAKSQGFDKATDDTQESVEDLRVYSCSHCGAQVVTDKDTAATACVFCRTPLVLENSVQGEFKPDGIIPFQVDKKQVEDLYEKYISTKPFYPEEYSKANVIEKIKAIYLPFWLYDTTMTGSMSGTGERTHTFTTRDWIVTEHDVFALQRAGDMPFKKIPVVATKNVPYAAADSIEPYDYSKLTRFQKGYLPGFLASRFDVDKNDIASKAYGRAHNTMEKTMESTMVGYEGLVVNSSDIHPVIPRAIYTLMPAYLLFMDYDNDEDKMIAINGQTGKVAGNIPVDTGKRNRYFLSRFLLFFVIFTILYFLIWMVL